MEVFENIVQKFESKHILVLGDLYLEEHIRGQAENMSSEGPIQEVEIAEKNYYPGAAGHSAALLQALGFKAHLIGLVGHDSNGKILLDELLKKNINIDGVFIHEDLTTNTRTRISVSSAHSPNQEVMRVSTPNCETIAGAWQEKLMKVIRDKIALVDAILFVDKQSVLINPKFIKPILELARKNHKIIIGDSDRNREMFQDFDLLVCNDREAAESTGVVGADDQTIETAGRQLQKELNNKYVIITRGPQGMSVVNEKGVVVHLPTNAHQIFDLTGAGETVSATVAAALSNGLTIVQAARLANYAAGVAVQKPGLAVVAKSELLRQIRKESAQLDAAKVVELAELKNIVTRAKKKGKIVAWTNGCFDIMHVGHILYLQHARAQGDLLVVGLNSDVSIRAFKGPSRPIVEESQRAKLLASLTCVDYVIIFSDTSPIGLIDALKPDVYVKGGDYTIDTIDQNERRLVEGYGGIIALMPGVQGMSTTNIIKKILTTKES